MAILESKGSIGTRQTRGLHHLNCSPASMAVLNREGYSHTLPTRVCAAQRGRDFEAPDLEQGIHFRGVF